MKGKVWLLGATLLTASLMVAGPASAENAKVAVCAGCHGMDGKSPNPDLYPNLAGQSAKYLEMSIKSYKPGGTRTNAPMQGMAAMLSDQDITELAEYFAGNAAK